CALSHVSPPNWIPFPPTLSMRRGLTSLGHLHSWYIAEATDRWLHYDQIAVSFGYVLFSPLAEIPHVPSTILFLSRTYRVIWGDIKKNANFRRVIRKRPLTWWLAAKIALFLVILLSLYYITLSVAAAAVWVRFYSLNVIADVATKRSSFALATYAFYSA